MAMPLVSYPNPVEVSEPTPPKLDSKGESSMPAEDHIFGDVIGTIRGGLLLVFGGGAEFEKRMRAYNEFVERDWNQIKNLDLGHKTTGLEALTVRRDPNNPEYDQQDYRFGIYSKRLKWRLCKCVSTNGYMSGSREVRHIEIPRAGWIGYVLAGLSDLESSLVDKSALDYYLTHPGESRKVPVEVTRFKHLAGSRTDVLARLSGIARPNDRQRKLQVVCDNWRVLVSEFSSLLMHIEANAPKTYNTITGGWDSQSWFK